jgi:hypothetical protein
MMSRRGRPTSVLLLQQGSALVVSTTLTFFLFVLVHRLATDPAWLARQYLSPARGADEIWGRIVSGGLLLVAVGWGLVWAALICLHAWARLRGRPSPIGRQRWLTGAASTAFALILALLAVRAH